MEIMKFKIDESTARSANLMNSFDDYKDGSETETYLSYLNKFSNTVDELRQRAKVEVTKEIEDAIQYYANRYSYKIAQSINRRNQIEAMCPSVMISGAGNFPIRKKEKQNKAREKFWEETKDLYSEDNYYMRKIENLLMNTTIYSNDEFAIEKLKDRIEQLEERQQLMKDVNSYWKKNGNLDDFDSITDETKKQIITDMQYHNWDCKPFPSYELTNNNADIRRNKERLEQLLKLKARAEDKSEDKYINVDGVKVEEDASDMRIRIIFDDIPSVETRELLKHWGFKWSPKNSAWQRQLTTNGIYATKKVLEQLKEAN